MKTIRRTQSPVLISLTIVFALTTLGVLGYHFYTIHQTEMHASERVAELSDINNQLRSENSKLQAKQVTNNPDAPVSVTADDQIIAVAKTFNETFPRATEVTPTIVYKDDNFADVSLGNYGVILKKVPDGQWVVVSHGQQLDLDDARTFGIPVDANSEFYKSLTPSEREGLTTR